MYEPVTLHKYLYANANPVKYSDPSGMFSLPQLNCAVAMQSMWDNRVTIMALGVLSGVTNFFPSMRCCNSFCDCNGLNGNVFYCKI